MWFAVSVYCPIPDHFVSVFDVISQRKEAEKELKESRSKYRAMIEAFDGYIYICASDYRIEYMNDKLIQRTGRDARGEYCYKALHDLDEVCEWCVNGKVFAGETVRWELQSPKDGRCYEVTNAPILNANGTISKQAMIVDITERKQYEETLQKSEQKFRTLFEQSMDGVLITIPDGQIISANPAACVLFGRAEQELCELGRAAVVDTSDPRLATALEERAQKGYINIELTCIRRNGEKFPAEVSSVITDKEKKYSYVIIRDITERKQAEAALKKISMDMQRILETAATGLTRCSRNLYYLSANPAYAELAGVPLEQIIGMPIVGVMGREGLASIMPYVERVLNGERVEFETKVPFKESGAKFLHVIYTPDEDGRGDIIGWVASVTDITERKQIENALRESENLFRTLALNAPVGIFQTDPDGNCVYVNRKWSELAGLTEEEAMGTGWSNALHPEDRDKVITGWYESAKAGILFNLEYRFITPSGTVHWVSGVASSLKFASNVVSGYIGSVTDITERIHQEEKRLLLEKQLQQTQRLESLGVLAGGIAHDFNNILAIIMGYCSLTKMDFETAEKNIPQIEKAVERAAGLCRQMLAYAGKTQYVEAKVNLEVQVSETVNLLKASIPQNVAIKYVWHENIPPIKADASQISQVAMNLIINASESIGEAQGEVLVSLSKKALSTGQHEKDYLGKIIPPGWYACLEVTDNGCGMSDETYNRIFEPFYTTKFTGRGLGMSAVLGIVTAHRGALQLFSEPGKGTTFKVYLPVQIIDSNTIESSQQIASTPWQGSGTILLVEDEEQVKMIARTMLQTMGFSVLEANNGKEALELYKKNASDITLVVTDMGMPVMDGYALFRELKTLAPELPIIISSGYGDTVVTSRLDSDDIAGMVNKPYSFEKLQDMLKRVVEG